LRRAIRDTREVFQRSPKAAGGLPAGDLVMGGREEANLRTDLVEQRDEVYAALKNCFRSLAQTPYPEAIEPRPESLGRACFTGLDDPENPVTVMEATGSFLEAAGKYWDRVLGQAVVLATQVEQAWGLERLPEVTPLGERRESRK
ncbi:MAG: hypothetical protein ACKOGA_20225, partial [Planctomycetaceae bacterium]